MTTSEPQNSTRDQEIEEFAWSLLVDESISAFARLMAPTAAGRRIQILETHFTIEAAIHRYTIKNSTIPHLTIFPWLMTKAKRYREVLNGHPSIDTVIKAMNFFLHVTEYTNADLVFLNNYLNKLHENTANPLTKFSEIIANPLTKCVEMRAAFEKYRLERELADLKQNQGERLDQHEQRIEELQNQLDSLDNSGTVDHGGKKRKKGGDRASFYRLHPEYYPSRATWCVPGGVFGLYSEGVGPLFPNNYLPRRSVVVYSADPDTLEAHPDPAHADHYVPIVMVGEAPVALRDDQYTKLKNLGCNCDIYVNHMGEVCVRSFDKDPPNGGMVFATTSWHDNSARIVNGYPEFQGVRGVCAKIFEPTRTGSVNAPSGVEKLVRDVSQSLSISNLLEPSTPEKPLDVLIEKRRQLNDELGSIERQHATFRSCKPHRQTLEAAITKNLELITLYSSSMNVIDKNETMLQSTAALAQEMILQLLEMNKQLNSQVTWLANQSSMNIQKYKTEKGRVEAELEKVKQQLKKLKKT